MLADLRRWLMLFLPSFHWTPTLVRYIQSLTLHFIVPVSKTLLLVVQDPLLIWPWIGHAPITWGVLTVLRPEVIVAHHIGAIQLIRFIDRFFTSGTRDLYIAVHSQQGQDRCLVTRVIRAHLIVSPAILLILPTHRHLGSTDEVCCPCLGLA